MSPPAIAPEEKSLTVDELRSLARARLRQSLSETEPSVPWASDYDLNPDLLPLLPGDLTPAAVLVPIVARDPLTVLLTLRTAHLPAHAGQIAFPGGKIEPGDDGPLAAALREAEEEIGLAAENIELLGYLDPYRTGTGYLIAPVVALVAAESAVTPNPAEVDDVFEVPFGFLMSAGNHRIDSRVWRGAERRFYAMPYEQRYIWGATAGIIRMLHRTLLQP